MTLDRLQRDEIHQRLRAELAGASFPYGDRQLLGGFDPNLALRVAEDLASVLLLVAAARGTITSLEQAIDRVRAVYSKRQVTPPADRVLLFLIAQYHKDGGGSVAQEVAERTHLPVATVRRVLRNLSSHGVVRRSNTKLGAAYLWYYTPTSSSLS